MESKKINQLATELTPALDDLTIIGDPTTGISKKITLSQMASLFTGTVEEYANVAAFPLVGVADTIYIALDTNVLYRWNTGTSAYVELSPNIINSLVFSDANGFDGNISLVGSTATLTITTALTTGSVGFIGASGALLQDNANFFWDDTNNRLGIGTNAPTTAIDVFGSGIIGRLNGTSTNNAFLGFASAGSNKWSIGNVQSDHRFRIYSEATTSELVSILSTGEFGIGISNPTTKLHIDGGASALIANLDANVSVAKSISFRSDNSNRINLEVSGTESGSNAGANFYLRAYSDAGALLSTPLTITRSTGAATFSNNITALSITTSAYSYLYGLRISGNDTTNTIYASNANMGITADSGNTIFIGQAGASTTGLKIFTSSGAALFSNSITSSLGSSGVNFDSNAATTGSVNAYRVSNSTGIASYGIESNAGGVLMTLGLSNATLLQSVSNTALQLGTNQTARLTITNGGNVGISTNAPANLLHLTGSSATPSLRLGSISLGFYWDIGRENASTGDFVFNNASGGSSTEKVRITTGGFFGIGTSSPTNTLTIQNTGENSIEWHRSNVMQGMIGIPSAANQIITGSSLNDFCFRATNNLLFSTGGDTERMRVTSGGIVLINRTATGGQAGKLQIETTGTDAIYIKQSAAGGYGFAMSAFLNAGTYYFMNFDAGTTGVGSITSNGVTTSYNTTSDYRLKQDLKDYNGLNLICDIKTYDYEWKSNKSRSYGVLAHQLFEIIPDAVTGEKDGEKMQGVDYSKIVPILVKAVQELKSELDILKAK